ncbi:unnamed protein product, partial [Owenia fusiformis]
VWSDELEVCAMKHAKNCPGGHSDMSCGLASGYPMGENMHWFPWPPTKAKLESQVYDWWKELYSPGYDWYKARAVNGIWASTGHYTIQDGYGVTEVGCGFVDCSAKGKWSTFVCQYRSRPGKRAKAIGDYVESIY